MAEEKKLKTSGPPPEMLKRIRILQNLEVLEMMKELKLLERKVPPPRKGERK